MNNLAPIVLFVYNRLEHTMMTIEALKQNRLAGESRLIIYSDGAKDEEKQLDVKKVREYITNISGFKEVKLVLSEENKGLSRAIISGVTEIINEYEKVIVMEDDLITAPYFLEYMNDSLTKYMNDKKVFSITGYSHFDKGCKKLDETYFLHLDSSWTWATWKDRWDLFDVDAKGWQIVKQNLRIKRRFNFDNTFDKTRMMIMQMELGTIDSWAIRWYWTIFKNEGLTLFPNMSLCKNIGLDGSGVHCGSDPDIWEVDLFISCINSFPDQIEENLFARKRVIKYVKGKQFVKKWKNYGRYILHPKKLLKRLKIVGDN